MSGGEPVVVERVGTVAVRGGLVTVGGQAGRVLVQLVSVVVLSRLLSPGDFGLVAMVTALVGLAALLGDFGLSLAAIQATEATHQQRTNLFWLNAAIGAVTSLVVLAVSPLIQAFYGVAEVGGIARALAVTFLLSALSAQFRAEATRRLRFTALAVVDLVAPALGLVAAVLLALAGAGFEALVAQQIAVVAAQLVLLVVLASWLPGLPRRTPGMGGFLRFGRDNLLLQVLTYASSNVDAVVVGVTTGPAVLGTYNRAVQLFRLPVQQLAAPLTRVALPILARVTDHGTYVRYLNHAQRYLVYTLGTAFALTAGLAAPVVALLLGPQWRGAAPILTALAVGGIFQALSYAYYWHFLASAQTALQLRFSVVSRVLMVVLILASSAAGPVAIAWASSLGLLVNCVLLTCFALPRSGVAVREISGTALRASIAVLGVAALSWLGATLGDRIDVAAGLALGLAGAAIAAAASAAARPVRRDLALLLTLTRKVRSA